MSFINNTYFNRDINLTSGQLNNMTFWISEYEPEILEKLLGYNLYSELISDLDIDGNPQSQKFIDLVDGKEFSFDLNGYTINTKWKGLRNNFKKSLIAYYVYYQYRINNESFNSSVGQVITNTENSVHVDAKPELIIAWNKMIDLYGFIPYNYVNNCFLDNSNYIHYNNLPSAYNYLLANIVDFNNWVFEPIETQNILFI